MFLFPPLLLRARWDQNGITGDRHERQEIKGPLMFSPVSVCVCVCVCVWERERERWWERQEDGRASENIYFLFWLSVVLVTFSWEAFELSTLFEPSRTKVGLTVDNTLSFCRSLCLSLLSQRVRTCWASTSVLYDGLFLNLSLGNWGNFESFLCFCNALKLFIFSSTCSFWTLRKKEHQTLRQAGRH